MADDPPRKQRTDVVRQKKSGASSSSSPTKKQKVATETTPPRWLLEVMMQEGGYDPCLVIRQKMVTSTDLNENQRRLLLPPDQVLTTEFLKEEELKALDAKRKQGVSALFIDRKSAKHDLELRKWVTGFVLTTGGWINVIEAKVLAVGDNYPLWCFRSSRNNDRLCFSLVRDVKDNPTETRFAVLLKSLLSNQSKDQVSFAIRRLQENGLLTPEAIDKADESTIRELICSDGSDATNIATNIKEIANTCLRKFNGDIPRSLEHLQSLPGIDPNMAVEILRLAWNDVLIHSEDGEGGSSLPGPSLAGGSLPDVSLLGPSLPGGSLPDVSLAGGSSLPGPSLAGGSYPDPTVHNLPDVSSFTETDEVVRYFSPLAGVPRGDSLIESEDGEHSNSGQGGSSLTGSSLPDGSLAGVPRGDSDS